MAADNTFQSFEDIGRDHARTHASTAGQHPRVDAALTAEDRARLQEDGFVVFTDLIAADTLARIRQETQPHLTHRGRNDLEGLRTRRIYSVAAKSEASITLAEHPRVLCLLDEMLMPNYLLSMFQIIEILPGEKQQILHYDDVFYPLPRPRPAVSVASILAVDDFTEENGATVYIPGSHRWDDARRPTPEDRALPLLMPAGSVAVFLGTLWHGGGANRSEHSRLAVTCQYCEPWARTQENMFLAVPPPVVARLSPSMQRMLGYSIHAPFMGNVGGRSPLSLLPGDDNAQPAAS